MRHLILVAAGEATVGLRTLAWPVARLRPLPQPVPLPGLRPVLLLHGYMGHHEMMRPIARYLLDRGWPRVERPAYPSWRWSVDQIGDLLSARAERLFDEFGPIDVVAHSLGAVAARAWLKQGPGAKWVRRFVSLGGPHRGTALYRVVPGPLREVFNPKGPFVQRLNEGAEPVPTTVIRAAWDHQVFPPVRARITGLEERLVHTHGHNGLLWSREAHEAVAVALSAADPAHS